MDTILDMKKVFLSSVYFSLFPIDVACDNIFLLFVSGYYIGISFWQDVPVTAIMDEVSL